MNYVKLEGNLGRDPDKRKTPGGHDVANVSLATKYEKDGKSYTTWHRIIAWGDTANALAKYRQGDKIRVEGYIAYNEWEGKDGVKHRDAEVNIFSIELLFKKGSGKTTNPTTERGTASGKDSDSPY